MKELASCDGPISGEHLISDSVIRVLMADGELSVSGMPWLDPGETRLISPKSLRTNCLCVKHNSMLTKLDECARRFFDALKSFLELEIGLRHSLVSGHDIERWILKTAKAMAASRSFANDRQPLAGKFVCDNALIELLDDPSTWPDGTGLYCTMRTGDTFKNDTHAQFQPITNGSGEIVAVRLNMLGIMFLLLLQKDELSLYPDMQDATYRPGRINVSYPRGDNWLGLSWDDGMAHNDMLIQRLRLVS